MNKPAGLVCHPTRDGEASSLIGRVRLHLGHRDGCLVNRLDRETSGVTLVAKHRAAAASLGRSISASDTDKRYWAIVHGHVADEQMIIDAPLGRDDLSPVAIKDTVRADGAPARTEVRVIRRFHGLSGPCTWLEVRPWTGRKHQVRIHLAHAGHSLLGDKIYGVDEQIYLRFVRRELTAEDRATLCLTHHALHARRLEFAFAGRSWAFVADPGEEFVRALCFPHDESQ